jgi:hypothetical protein
MVPFLHRRPISAFGSHLGDASANTEEEMKPTEIGIAALPALAVAIASYPLQAKTASLLDDVKKAGVTKSANGLVRPKLRVGKNQSGTCSHFK